MADESLKGKAGLDTTDFKTGIATMNRELRVLESGFRASAASLGDWTNDATGLEARIKSLGAQMEIQERKVAATRAEYERVRAEKGENSRAAQDLEIKLNKETETLGKMQSELSTTTESLDELQTGSDETGQAVDQMGESSQAAGGQLVDLSTVVTGLNSVLELASKAFDVLKGAIAAVYDATVGLVLGAADAAAELVDLSAKTGISTTQLQEMSYIGDQVGTSLDTITSSQARLVRSMASAQDQQSKFNEALADGKMEDEINVPIEMAAAFNGLGVAFTDSAGNLRNQQDVFNEVIDALGRIQNPAERDALAMQIFGKSAQELNPLIKAGSAELARLATEAHDVGAVMSEDTVAGLEAFDDTLASIQAGVKGTLGTLAGQLLPVFQTIGTALQDLFKSDEFKNAVEGFAMILEGVVEDVVGVMQKLLSGDIEGALTDLFGVENAGAILNLIGIIRDFIQGTLLPFFQNNAGEINVQLSAIVGAIIQLATWVAQLAIAWVNGWIQLHEITAGIWEGFLQPLFGSLQAWLGETIPQALATLSEIWTGTLLPAIQVVWAFISDNLFPLFEAVADFLGAVFNVVTTALAGIFQNLILPALQSVYSAIADRLQPIFEEISEFIQRHVQPVFEKFGDFIADKMVPAFQAIGNAIGVVIEWLHTMADQLNSLQLPDWLTPGSPTPWEIGLDGINRAMDELNSKLPTLAKGLQLQPGGAPLGVGSLDQSSNVQVIGNVIIRGDTTAGSLGAALTGRRF